MIITYDILQITNKRERERERQRKYRMILDIEYITFRIYRALKIIL